MNDNRNIPLEIARAVAASLSDEYDAEKGDEKKAWGEWERTMGWMNEITDYCPEDVIGRDIFNILASRHDLMKSKYTPFRIYEKEDPTYDHDLWLFIYPSAGPYRPYPVVLLEETGLSVYLIHMSADKPDVVDPLLQWTEMGIISRLFYGGV